MWMGGFDVRRRSGGTTYGCSASLWELQMSWLSTRHLKRSLAVNGEMLKFYRSRRGWTQEELATVAGYTGRVIRKAESSGSLHPDTIEILAEALSGADWTVDPEDLVTTPELMARAVINAYRYKERQVVANVNGLLHENLIVYAAGEEVGLPFAGSYSGVDGFDRFFGNYFEAFVRPDKQLFQPMFYSQGNEVILHGQEAVQANDSQEVISSWIFIKFTFERGRLIRYENFYDTGKAAQYLKTLGEPGKSRGE
jgi:transcriptional regulator with XRE-family HTH domain